MFYYILLLIVGTFIQMQGSAKSSYPMEPLDLGPTVCDTVNSHAQAIKKLEADDQVLLKKIKRNFQACQDYAASNDKKIDRLQKDLNDTVLGINKWINRFQSQLDSTDRAIASHSAQFQTGYDQMFRHQSALDQHTSVINKNEKTKSEYHAKVDQLGAARRQHEQMLQELKTKQAELVRQLAPQVFVGKKSKPGKQIRSFQETIKQQMVEHQVQTGKIIDEQAQQIKQQQEQITQLQKQNKQNERFRDCILGGLCAYAAWTSWVAHTSK